MTYVRYGTGPPSRPAGAGRGHEFFKAARVAAPATVHKPLELAIGVLVFVDQKVIERHRWPAAESHSAPRLPHHIGGQTAERLQPERDAESRRGAFDGVVPVLREFPTQVPEGKLGVDGSSSQIFRIPIDVGVLLHVDGGPGRGGADRRGEQESIL